MKVICAVGIVMVVMTGCGRPPVITAMAPEGALGCAVAHAEAAGYEVVEGSVSRGNVRLIRDIEPGPEVSRGDPPPADIGATLLNRPTESAHQEQLLLRYSRGQLEATAVGLSGSSADDGGGDTAGQAALILNLCAADPSALPIGAESGADASPAGR